MISIVPLLAVVPVPMCRKCTFEFCTRRLVERKLQMITWVSKCLEFAGKKHMAYSNWALFAIYVNMYFCHAVRYPSFLVHCHANLLTNPTTTKINLQIFPPACLLSLHCTCTCSSLPPVWRVVQFCHSAPAVSSQHVWTSLDNFAACLNKTLCSDILRASQFWTILFWHDIESYDGFSASSIFMVLVSLITFDLQSVISGDLDPK